MLAVFELPCQVFAMQKSDLQHGSILEFLQNTETFMLAVLEPKLPKPMMVKAGKDIQSKREQDIQMYDLTRKLLVV